jgi:hypothetical protein
MKTRMNILLIAVIVIAICALLFSNYPVLAFLDGHSGSVMAILTFFLVLGTIPTLLMAITASEQLRIQQQPIILRSGVIPNWEWFTKTNVASTSALTYEVYKNHATDIKGHLTLRGIKYPLLFGLVSSSSNGNLSGPGGLSSVSWVAPNAKLLVYPNWDKAEKANTENQIEILYKDISGIVYCSIEKEDFSSSIRKCN